MKTKKTIFISVVTIVIIILLAMYYFLYININFNNVDNKNDLITVSYSEKRIDDLIADFEKSRTGYALSIDSLHFKKQCVRKTNDSGYIILKEDTGKEIYVFFNSKREIISIIRIQEFLENDIFDFIVVNSTTANEIIKHNEGYIRITSSSNDTLLYFLKNDIIFIRFNQWIFDGDQTVSEVDKMSDYEYLQNNSNQNWKPYILPIDRANHP